MFDIHLSTEVVEEPEDAAFRAVYGSIQIGEFTENFVASLSAWSPERYEHQWREACRRLVDGELKSAFVTSFVPPDPDEYFEWWPCYLCGETVYIHNQFRFYDQLPASLSVDALYDFVPDRRVISDDGSPLPSEWQVPLQCVREFLRRLVGPEQP